MAFPGVLTMIEVPTHVVIKMAAAVNLQIRVFGQEPLSSGDPATFKRWSDGSDGDLCTRLVSRSPRRRHVRLY